MRPILRATLLILAAFGSTNGARAGEPALTIPPGLIVQRFAVNKGGDALLVPVKIAGKDRLFLVDTGSSITFVDDSIPLGEPRKVVTGETADGGMKFKVYGAPAASVGEIPLGVDSVVGLDLKQFREVSGHPIEGILGMDFLGRYVIHVDVDRGELLLLKSVPENAGESLPIMLSSQNRPELEAWVSREQNVRFLIDTGWISRNSGSMEFLPMRWSGEFQEIGSALTESVSGTHSVLEFQGKRLSLGSFSVDRPIFLESPNSLLGLGFWSRFVVTFDFPGRKVYLRKGQAYERLDLRDLSGLHLLRRDGVVLIDRVDKNSLGSAADFQAGDRLLTMRTTRVDQTSLFELRKALSQPGTVECTVRRGNQERQMTLKLPR